MDQGGTARFTLPYVHSENAMRSCGGLIHRSLEKTNKIAIYFNSNVSIPINYSTFHSTSFICKRSVFGILITQGCGLPENSARVVGKLIRLKYKIHFCCYTVTQKIFVSSLTSAITRLVSPRKSNFKASSSLIDCCIDKFFRWMLWSKSSMIATFLKQKECFVELIQIIGSHKILTVGPPVETQRSWSQEGQIPSRCRSQDRRCMC